MEVILLREKYFSCITYLVIKNDSCIVIDAGVSLNTLKKGLQKYNIKKIEAVFLTHAHFDHILGLEDYINYLDVDVFVSSKGVKNLQDVEANYSMYTENEMIIKSNKIKSIGRKGKLKIGEFNIEALKTPGHTDDGVCYIVDNEIMFTGDTLFNMAVGRTDLCNSDSVSMVKSLKLLKKYTNFKKYYAGHGKPFDSKTMISFLKSMGF